MKTDKSTAIDIYYALGGKKFKGFSYHPFNSGIAFCIDHIKYNYVQIQKDDRGLYDVHLYKHLEEIDCFLDLKLKEIINVFRN